MKKFVFFPAICLIGIVCLTSLALAADKYVRKGASGSGTSWSDAYGDFNNVSLTGMSGSTLWVAAGSYTSGLGSINITNLTIKRATVAAHGTSTGWSNAYDGQVTIRPSGYFLNVASGANINGFLMDGVSNNPWLFKILGVSGPEGMIVVRDTTGFSMRNVEMDGNSEGGGSEDGIRFAGVNDVVIEHCFIHDYKHILPAHNDGIQHFGGNGFVYRYNVSKNNGQHMILGETAWGNIPVNDVYIYYNVFYNDSGGNAGSYNTIVTKVPNNVTYIENNVFAIRSSEGSRSCVYHSLGVPAEEYFRNNILYDSTIGDGVTKTHDHNVYYLSGTPPTETGRITANPLFTNYAGNVFTVQSSSPAKDAGANLGYTADLVGAPVPQNGSSDIGAYEVAAGGSLGPPSAPVSLTVR